MDGLDVVDANHMRNGEGPNATDSPGISDSPGITGPEHIAAAKTSPLVSVRDRIEKARRARIYDNVIPHTDYVIRYGPLGEERRVEIAETRGRDDADDKELEVLASADVLATTCIGIFEKVDGRLVSFDPENPGEASVDPETNEVRGTPLTFKSPRTRELLGVLGAESAVEVVRAFYPFDGDVINAGNAVFRLSGFFRNELAGNLGN